MDGHIGQGMNNMHIYHYKFSLRLKQSKSRLKNVCCHADAVSTEKTCDDAEEGSRGRRGVRMLAFDSI